jgi:hypothetical protein
VTCSTLKPIVGIVVTTSPTFETKQYIFTIILDNSEQSRIANQELQIKNCKSRIANQELQIKNCKSRIANQE